MPENVMASRIDKGYQALHQYDYFKAKKYFVKGLKYSPIVASQGLAIIFYRTDNPFHNYDSALFYIEKSILGWDMEKARKKERYAVYGFTEDSLHILRATISTKMYEEFKGKQDIALLTSFIDRHIWAKERPRAIEIRDSLAFFKVINSNRSEDYKLFADTYPESTYTPLALENYYDSQYMEQTGDGSLESFTSFVQTHPSSPLKPQAEKNIYMIVTDEKSSESFRSFINSYPNNSFIDSAWNGLFQLSISTYTKESFDEFLMNYPNTTIKADVLAEYAVMDSLFLPFIKEGKFGFMNLAGKQVSDAKYDYAGFFREGLAIVSYKDKYGFVNKLGKLCVPYQFSQVSDFVNGKAIVELNEKFGVIDRNGNFVFDCIFDDISTLSEGMAYASLNGKYGYYDANGEMTIAHNFDDAYDFKNDVAKVVSGDQEAFIAKDGSFVVNPCYESITPFYDTLYVFEDDGYFGLMNHKCQIFLEPEYDFIGPIKDGLSLAAIEDRIVYLDTLGRLIVDNGYEVFPNFMVKAEFNQDVAIVYKKEKYGRINSKHKELTPIKYQSIGTGKLYFPVQIDDKWGLFDKTNKQVVKPAYDALDLIDDKYLIAFKNDTVSVIDVQSKTIVPAIFDEIEYLRNNLFLVKQNGKLGVYQDTKLVVPVIYDQIGLFDEDFLFLNKAGLLEYLYIPEQRVIEIVENE